MRSIARVLIGGLIVACVVQPASAETGSKWWPFGKKDDIKTSDPPTAGATGTLPLQSQATPAAPNYAAPNAVPYETQMPATPAEKEHWMLNSSKGKIGWPHLNKPTPPSFLSSEKKAPEPNRNTWVEKTPAPPKPSAFKPVTDGAHKVADGTKHAWHKTVDALTPGPAARTTPPARSKSSSRIAKNDTKPSLWQRMFGPSEEPQGSQTMPGFLAQKRVDSSPNSTR